MAIMGILAPEVKMLGAEFVAKKDGKNRCDAMASGWEWPLGWKDSQKAALGQSGNKKRAVAPGNWQKWDRAVVRSLMGGQQKYITPGESVWAKKSIPEAEYCGEAAKKRVGRRC
jgi:hypothetical protein